jgi:ABC-2 type transport system ATP-binding protein
MTTHRSSSNPVAALHAVSKRFGATVALESFDLEIGRGELLALLGANGAGKSTAISILLGLRRPDAGTAALFGRPPQLTDARRRIGVMMQEMSLPPELTVRELVGSISSYYPNPLGVEAAIRLAGIEPIASRRYGVLSGGQKRQAQFALAVCGAPQLLFLDEPTTHLDQQARELLWERVRRLVQSGTSVVLTTHYIEEAEALADRIAVIANGRGVASGTVEKIRSVAVRQRVECTTKLGLEELRTWPEIEQASVVAGRLSATTANSVALVERLIAADPALRDLEVRRATLSEALSLITKEHAA